MEQAILKVLQFKKDHNILFWILIPLITLLLVLYIGRDLVLGYLSGQSSKDLKNTERTSQAVRQEIAVLNQKAEDKIAEANSLKAEEETNLDWNKKKE